jgi:hypothetical protein
MRDIQHHLAALTQGTTPARNAALTDRVPVLLNLALQHTPHAAAYHKTPDSRLGSCWVLPSHTCDC